MNHVPAPDEFAQLHEGSTLVIQRWFPGSAARLWAYLVDADLRRKWFADGVMHPEAGAALELIWRNDDLSRPADPRPDGAGGEQRMQSLVIEAIPLRRLVIAWGEGAVAFDFFESDGRVRLTITHSGLDASQTGIFAGWHSHLDILSAQISGTTVPSFWTGWMRLRDQYRSRLQPHLATPG